MVFAINEIFSTNAQKSPGILVDRAKKLPKWISQRMRHLPTFQPQVKTQVQREKLPQLCKQIHLEAETPREIIPGLILAIQANRDKKEKTFPQSAVSQPGSQAGSYLDMNANRWTRMSIQL